MCLNVKGNNNFGSFPLKTKKPIRFQLQRKTVTLRTLRTSRHVRTYPYCKTTFCFSSKNINWIRKKLSNPHFTHSEINVDCYFTYSINKSIYLVFICDLFNHFSKRIMNYLYKFFFKSAWEHLLNASPFLRRELFL